MRYFFETKINNLDCGLSVLLSYEFSNGGNGYAWLNEKKDFLIINPVIAKQNYQSGNSAIISLVCTSTEFTFIPHLTKVIKINFISITEIFFLEAPPLTSTVFVGDSRELITLEVRPESLIEYDVQVTIFKDIKEEITYDHMSNESYVYPVRCSGCSAY
jgi:hypothetical protein